MSVEGKIEISIFERKLSDCHDKDDLLKLCEEFVNKHDPPKPKFEKEEQGTSILPKKENFLSYPLSHITTAKSSDSEKYLYKEPQTFHRRIVIDENRLHDGPYALLEAKRDLLSGFGIDLFKHGYVKMIEQQRYDTLQREIIASIGAYKL